MKKGCYYGVGRNYTSGQLHVRTWNYVVDGQSGVNNITRFSVWVSR